MKIYNTLTRMREDFVPVSAGKASIYVCGPTVYSYIHIGNARPIVVFDVLRRYMQHIGYDVTYVTNFTDVDDKIIKRANEEGVDFSVISERFIEAFQEDAKKLNTLAADYNPRVTEEIDDIIAMIQKLIKTGFAYEKNASVYFSTDKYAEYGRLSGKKIKELEAGSRVEVNSEKLNPMDFVLWKPAKPNEPSWSSPWGEGRPGWHIECSAMSKKYLGDTIDIHAGGDDLIFPHHENEIAQSEAANGKKFVNYWMHNGMINVDGRKMAKSEGNFVQIRDITKDFSYDTLRFCLLTVHYRSPFNFSRELMLAAETSLERIRNCYANLKYLITNAKTVDMTDEETEKIKDYEAFRTQFSAALDDDLNTANAITAIFELVKFTNINATNASSRVYCENIVKIFDELCGILGITFEKSADVDSKKIEALIEERQLARKNKDFAAADRIRNELNDMGINLTDTTGGVKWTVREKK